MRCEMSVPLLIHWPIISESCFLSTQDKQVCFQETTIALFILHMACLNNQYRKHAWPSFAKKKVGFLVHGKHGNMLDPLLTTNSALKNLEALEKLESQTTQARLRTPEHSFVKSSVCSISLGAFQYVCSFHCLFDSPADLKASLLNDVPLHPTLIAKSLSLKSANMALAFK